MTSIPDKSATQDNANSHAARRRKVGPPSAEGKGPARSAPRTKTHPSAKPAKQQRSQADDIRSSQDRARSAHAFGPSGLVGTSIAPKLEVPATPAVGQVASGIAGWMRSALGSLEPFFGSAAPSSKASDGPTASEGPSESRTTESSADGEKGDDFLARLEDQLKTSFKIDGHTFDVQVSVKQRVKKPRAKKPKRMSEKEAAKLPPTERWRANPLTVKDLNIPASANSEHVHAMAHFLQTNADSFAPEGKLKENLDRVASETGKPLFLDPLFALQPLDKLWETLMKANYTTQYDGRGNISTAESDLLKFEFFYYPDKTLEGFRRMLKVPDRTEASGNSEPTWTQLMAVSIFHDKFKDDRRRRNPGPANVTVQEVHDDGLQPVTTREDLYTLPIFKGHLNTGRLVPHNE